METMLLPLNPPVIDISPFNSIVARSTVGEVDVKRIPPVSKFALLVDETLPGMNAAYRHLYQAFYFRVPYTVTIELSQFQYFGSIKLCSYADGMMSEGIISASFDVWHDLLTWGMTAERSKWMQAFCKSVHGALKHHACFQTDELRMLC